MPRRRNQPRQKLVGEGIFDTFASWGRTLRDYPKLIADGPVAQPIGSPPSSSTGLPDKSILKDIADNSYKGTTDEMTNIPGYTLKLKTPTLVIYQKDDNNVMVIGVRGTADFRDFRAWFSTAFNVIPDSDRFREDLATITRFQQDYPVSIYTYYATGHSLGGTLIDELIKKGMVKEARTYNPAIETDDIPNVSLSQKNHRIYADGDPLYLLQGRYDHPTEVRKSYKYYPSSMYDFVPGYDKYKQHVLANPVFVGGASNPFFHLQGCGKAYTADEWEAKLCKGPNSLLEQKKRKIKERAEKGVPDLETPMRTSRVIKATPPKEQPRQAPRPASAPAPKPSKDFYPLEPQFGSNPKGIFATSSQLESQVLKETFFRILTDYKDNFKTPALKTRLYNKIKKADADEMSGMIIQYFSPNCPKRIDYFAQKKFLETFGEKMSGKGMMANSQFYRTDPKRNPLLRGEGIFDDIKAGIEKVTGKMPERATLSPAEQADVRRRQHIQDVDKQRAKMVAQKKQVAVDDAMGYAQHPNALKAIYAREGTDNAKDYLARVVERATAQAERFYPYHLSGNGFLDDAFGKIDTLSTLEGIAEFL